MAEVPRALVALIQRCSRSGVALSSLEKEFFFEFLRQSLNIKRADIIRESIHFLKCLGLVEQEQNTIRRSQYQSLKSRSKNPAHWLQNRFEQAANHIRAIHLQEGENLVDMWATRAKHWLKDAQNRLEDLTRIHRQNLEGAQPSQWRPACLRRALAHRSRCYQRNRLELLPRVYDPKRDRALSYVPEAIEEFSSCRLAVTIRYGNASRSSGFYKEVDDRRKGC